MKYTVKPGDVLSTIAVEYYGPGNGHLYTAIAEVNRIPPPHTIYPGRTLELPDAIKGVRRKKGSSSVSPGASSVGPGGSGGMTKGQRRLKPAARQQVLAVPRERLALWLYHGRMSAHSTKPPTHQELPRFTSVQEYRDWLLAVEQIAWDKKLYEYAPRLYSGETHPPTGFEPLDETGKKVTRDRLKGPLTK